MKGGHGESEANGITQFANGEPKRWNCASTLVSRRSAVPCRIAGMTDNLFRRIAPSPRWFAGVFARRRSLTQSPQSSQSYQLLFACGGSLQKSPESGKPLRPAGSRTSCPPKYLCPAHALRRSRKRSRVADEVRNRKIITTKNTKKQSVQRFFPET